MPGQKPVAKFKAGQVSSAIWANSIPVKNGGTATILKASVQRRFKDRDSTWKSSGSFSRNEIPLTIYCLEKCFEHMIESPKDEDNSSDSEKEEAMY